MSRCILQAIETKFIGPTNSRGSRVKATAAAKSITVEWEYSLNPDGNHRAAAEALAKSLGWEGGLAQGVLKSGNNVFVFV